MTQAQDVFKQITSVYGVNAHINKLDLSNHLRSNRIDTGVGARHNHWGFNSPMNYDDAIPLVLYYKDKSLLIVTMDRVLTGTEDVE